MKKPYGEFNTFTADEIEAMIQNEFIAIAKSVINGDKDKIILDIIHKKESNFLHLFADMYVSTYKIQREINNLQRMIADRQDELNKLLDLYDQTLKLVQNKLNDEEY